MSEETKTHAITRARVRTVELEGLELVVIDGPDRGNREPVRYGATRVGTAQGCQLRLSDPTVSRIHCEVRLAPDAVRIVDAGSTNGTFLDGHRVFEAELTSGTVARIGATALRLERGPEPLHVQVSERDGFGKIVGKSLEMRRIYTIIERVAPTDTTVLLQGETGTGKEVVARTIHDASPRANGPFVAVDCGAIAENLIEGELFGHVRGSFTGAVGDRVGMFEEANGGTLFLDEIGEMPLSVQPKLLRAIDAREVRPVGSSTSRAVNVRIIAATNRQLNPQVNEGLFRDDLYYRLAVVEIGLPALRARREDIPVLAAHFYRAISVGGELPEELIPALAMRSWPGNVRELRNFVERCIALGWNQGATANTRRLCSSDVEALVPSDLPLKEARAEWLSVFERAYVRALLKKTNGNVSRAADLAGVNRRTIQRMLAEYPKTDGEDL